MLLILKSIFNINGRLPKSVESREGWPDMAFRGKKFARLYTWHRWAGLYLLPHLLVLFISGSILVFRHELKPEPMPRAASEGASTGPVKLQSLLDSSQKLFPSDRPLALDVDSDAITVRMGLDGSKKFSGSRRVPFDPQSGAYLEQKDAGDHWTDWVLRLHREFFLGFYGKLYVSWLGLVTGFALISGLIVYGPLMKRRLFGSMRINLARRWNPSDLHKTLGLSLFAWSLMMAVSGLFLGLSGQLLKVFQATSLKAWQTQSELLGSPVATVPALTVDAALAKAQAQLPEGRLSFVSLPDTQFSTRSHYIFVMEGSEAWNERLSELVLVHAFDPAAAAVVQELPWYLKTLVLSEPLHFGDYGGLGLKLVWALLGLVSMALPLSGLFSYLRKRRLALAKSSGEIILPFGFPLQLRPLFARPYLLGLSLSLLSLGGSLGALFLEGPLEKLAVLLIVLPLALLGFFAFSWVASGQTWTDKKVRTQDGEVSL